MQITIYGAGYVGLVTAACFAEMGNQVICVDIDQARITRLQEGECPIHEPGLPEMLANHRQAGRLRFTTSIDEGVAHGLYQFIAVGTPSDVDGSADLKYVTSCARSIAERLDGQYRVVVVKSTVPVGTCDAVKKIISETLHARNMFAEISVVSNPEFLREGAAISDFMECDRIIVGTSDLRATQTMADLYTPFDRGEKRTIYMDVRSSELTKYAANAMLATKISFMNEMSQLADRLGSNIESVRLGIGSDPRIGAHFLHAGCGFGGSCFPKDVRALTQMASAVEYQADLIQSVLAVNEKQKHVLFQKLNQHFEGNLKNKTIAIWGLSFKPNTDDIREASSLCLMESLWKAGARVQAHDPAAMKEVHNHYGVRSDLTLFDTPEAGLKDADALVIVTEWPIFLSPNFAHMQKLLRSKVIVDGRNIYNPEHIQSLGFTYYSIGRNCSRQISG